MATEATEYEPRHRLDVPVNAISGCGCDNCTGLMDTYMRFIEPECTAKRCAEHNPRNDEAAHTDDRTESGVRT